MRPNIKGCIAARNEPANAPLVEHCPAAMSGITQAKPSRRACAAGSLQASSLGGEGDGLTSAVLGPVRPLL